MTKELKQLIRSLPPTWAIARTRGGHIKLSHRSGATVVCACTPSDWRSYRNARARIRRIERLAAGGEDEK